MKIIIIPGSNSEIDGPSPRFKARLDKALNIKAGEDVIIVSGRAPTSLTSVEKTEAEIGADYLREKCQNKIILETTSVESLGNLLFSMILANKLEFDTVIIVSSSAVRKRYENYCTKFLDAVDYEIVTSDLDEEIFEEREKKARKMYEKITSSIDGSIEGGIDALLTKTPFYNKGLVTEKEFFDEYWEGGYEDFILSREVVASE